MSDRASAVQALGVAARARRRHLGLTQDDAAELAGVAARTVHTIEAGKATVRLDGLLAVLSALGLQLRLERGNTPGAVVAPAPPVAPQQQ